MFSVGAIAAMLLTGEPLDHARNGLPSLDIADPEQWAVVGKRARRFIQQLLVLDEDHRLTVEQALEHSWFTNKHHTAEFEALYDRSIKDWQPRHVPAEVVEIPAESQNESAIRSKWFKAAPQQERNVFKLPGRITSVASEVVSGRTPTWIETSSAIAATIYNDTENYSSGDEPAEYDDDDFEFSAFLALATPSQQTALAPFNKPLFDQNNLPSVLLPHPSRETLYLPSPLSSLPRIKSSTTTSGVLP